MKANAIAQLTVTIQLTISEGEARFLDALTGYGSKPLLDVFKRLCGTAYLPSDEVCEKFCDSVREQIPSILNRVNDARAVFNKEEKAVSIKLVEGPPL